MTLLSVIRRWYHRDQMSIRDISRRTGLSRNTLRKYLRSEVVEPRFRTPERPSKLDPYADRLSAWLRRELTRPRKQRRTIKQLHADLVSLGYDGSYGRVAAFARTWQNEYRVQQQTSGRGTFVPLSFAPGEVFQFDWSEDIRSYAKSTTVANELDLGEVQLALELSLSQFGDFLRRCQINGIRSALPQAIS